jgi:hypothetical protein
MSANTSFGMSCEESYTSHFFGSIRRRILFSIAAIVGWLSLVLLYFAFWATGFTLFQDIVIVIVSLLLLGGILLSAWVSFGLKFTGRWD